MTQIPSLTHQQLEILRLAKKNSVDELWLSYEFPVLDDDEPPNNHPPFIQALIDHRFIQVQVKGTSLGASEFQQESWTEYREDLDYPTQADWDRWRQGFIAQLGEGHKHLGYKHLGYKHLMTPGEHLGQFTKVWIREIGLRGVQPSSL